MPPPSPSSIRLTGHPNGSLDALPANSSNSSDVVHRISHSKSYRCLPVSESVNRSSSTSNSGSSGIQTCSFCVELSGWTDPASICSAAVTSTSAISVMVRTCSVLKPSSSGIVAHGGFLEDIRHTDSHVSRCDPGNGPLLHLGYRTHNAGGRWDGLIQLCRLRLATEMVIHQCAVFS